MIKSSVTSVVHIVENLDKGAVENWLVGVFLESRKQAPDMKWTFYCILGKPGRLDQKVTEAGGEIVYAPYWISEKISFLTHLHRFLKLGKFDYLHVHHDYLSGFYLLATLGIPFKKRILHIHNTDKFLPMQGTLARNILLPLFRCSSLFLSDCVVGISEHTLKSYLKRFIRARSKGEVLYYGIDLDRFCLPEEDIKQQLGIAEEAKVLLFVGRMNELKNPLFVLEILRKILETRNDVYAIFIGSGGESLKIAALSKAYQIEKHVLLLGWRDNIPQFMKMADVFVFPRVEEPKEGLGIVVVEAQAAGLPMVLSPGIVQDAIVVPSLAHVISLSEPLDVWANKINEVLRVGKPLHPSQAYAAVHASKFGLSNGTINLLRLYT